jgi:hypothetical protein
MTQAECIQLMLLLSAYHPNVFKDEDSLKQTAGAYYLILRNLDIGTVKDAVLKLEASPDTRYMPTVGMIYNLARQRMEYGLTGEQLVALYRRDHDRTINLKQIEQRRKELYGQKEVDNS